MRFRWTIKELNKVSDEEFLRILCVERKSDCTNIYSPLYKKISEIEQRLRDKIGEKDKEEEEETNIHIEILQHDISYYFDCDSVYNIDKIEDGDCEYEHIVYMIGQGYRSGELNKTDPDNPDNTFRGWWEIKN